jgi:hypothetical protein
LDELLHCVAQPADVPDVVTALSGTTFVQVCAGLLSEGAFVPQGWGGGLLSAAGFESMQGESAAGSATYKTVGNSDIEHPAKFG